MSPELYQPTPRWVAKKLIPCGLETGLAVFSSGLLTMEDEPPNAWFAALADDPDPLHTVRTAFADADHYGWLAPATSRLTNFMVVDDPTIEEQVKRAAGLLADLDFEQFTATCRGDVLGPIWVEMTAIAQHKEPVYYCHSDLISDTIRAKYNPMRPGDSFIDTACASGTRAVMMAMWTASFTIDYTQCSWYLADYDAIALSLAAVNAAFFGFGPNVHFALVDFPANAREVWPGATFTHWITDIPETLARIYGNLPGDPDERVLPSVLLSLNPALRAIYAVAHGALEEFDDEQISKAREIVNDPDLISDMVESVMALPATEEEMRSEVADIVHEALKGAHQQS